MADRQPRSRTAAVAHKLCSRGRVSQDMENGLAVYNCQHFGNLEPVHKQYDELNLSKEAVQADFDKIAKFLEDRKDYPIKKKVQTAVWAHLPSIDNPLFGWEIKSLTPITPSTGQVFHLQFGGSVYTNIPM